MARKPVSREPVWGPNAAFSQVQHGPLVRQRKSLNELVFGEAVWAAAGGVSVGQNGARKVLADAV